MKKIFFLSASFLLLTQFVFAQDPMAGAKVMTIDEANKLNGVAQPTINGKSYSQYKAEQDALKKQQEVNKIAPVNKPKPSILQMDGDNVNPAPAKPVPVVDASLITKKVEAVTKPLPEVPEQFKLAAATPWDATPTNNAQPINNMRPKTTISSDPAQAADANLGVETYVSKPLTDNKLSAEEQKRAAQRAAYVPPAPVKVQAATEKNEAAVPILPQAFKIETIGAATEAKPTESKTQPVATPNNPNAAKTKTD